MAGRPPGEHSGSPLVVQRGKGIEQSMIFNQCIIHLYLLYLQTDGNSELALRSELSHAYNNICYMQYMTGDELKNARKVTTEISKAADRAFRSQVNVSPQGI